MVFISLDELLVELYHTENEIDFLKKAQIKDELEEDIKKQLKKKKKLEKDSSVVFVSSIGGVDSFQMGNGVYGASKAALNSMMKFCAKELAAKKIRVNTVNPGMVNTKLIQGGAISEEQHKMDMEKYPLKRYGEPEDIAYGIIYLLSDASSWVTGHSLVIDGGVTI